MDAMSPLDAEQVTDLARRGIAPLWRVLLRSRRRVRALLERWLPRLRRGEYIFVIITAIAVGILGGYGAVLFRSLIALVHHLFFASAEYTLETLQSLPAWRRLVMPSAGGLLVGLIVARLAPEVKGSGSPALALVEDRRGHVHRLAVGNAVGRRCGRVSAVLAGAVEIALGCPRPPEPAAVVLRATAPQTP